MQAPGVVVTKKERVNFQGEHKVGGGVQEGVGVGVLNLAEFHGGVSGSRAVSGADIFHSKK